MTRKKKPLSFSPQMAKKEKRKKSQIYLLIKVFFHFRPFIVSHNVHTSLQFNHRQMTHRTTHDA